MRSDFFLALGAIAAVIIWIVGDLVGIYWLSDLSIFVVFTPLLVLLIGLYYHRTTNEKVKITEVKSYRLAPLSIDEKSSLAVADDKYVMIDGGRVLFAYFAEDGVSISMNVEADHVGFYNVDNTMQVTIKVGKLVTRCKYFQIFFMEFTEDCTTYELQVPEDAILHKTSNGKYTQLEIAD